MLVFAALIGLVGACQSSDEPAVDTSTTGSPGEVEAPADDAVQPVGSGGIPPREDWPGTAVALPCATCESVFDVGGIVFEGVCRPVRTDLVGAVIAQGQYDVAELAGEPPHLHVAWQSTETPCEDESSVWWLATAGTTSDAVKCRVLQEPPDGC